MPSLSYKGMFCEYVENGLKPRHKGDRVKMQTIRNVRKGRPFMKGDTLYHFYGMRTKFCRRLGQSVCTDVKDITINHRAVYIGKMKGDWKEINTQKELDEFAYADGFDNWEAMRKWWILTHGVDCFPFHGQLIKW